MKKFILLSCCLLSSIGITARSSDLSGIIYTDLPDVRSFVPEDSYMVDEVLVIIYGPERTRVITKLEVERLSIDGRKRSLDDLIVEELIYQEGLKFKIQIDESVVDRYISNIRKQYSLSLEQVKEIFQQSGYTYQEGREQLRMMYATNSMVDNIIGSRLRVPREDVLAYYDKHPVIQEAEYTLQMTFVPFVTDKTYEEQKQQLAKSVKENKTDMLGWNDPLKLKESDIAQHMTFIKDMKVGDASTPIQVVGGFEMYRLVELAPQRTVPLENRYKEIENILRQPQFQKKLDEYKKSLYEFATIVHHGKKDSNVIA